MLTQLARRRYAHGFRVFLGEIMRVHALLLLFLASSSSVLHAQSTDASVTGRVTDPSKARIVGAKITAISAGTNIRYEVTTNSSGEYYLPNPVPGTYRIEVKKPNFKKLIKPDVILHVQDSLDIDFEMTVGSASESITVEGGAPLLNTESAAVSTLIENQFVENMPLNGRSFSSLIELTPGVVLTQSTFYDQGQFAVNGQRPDSNYFTVDGVSANLGTSDSNLGQGGAGQLPATSAFGGTSNLVSLDALQEFRIQTSSFAPEFGRTPGAQVSVVTKSGTNQFHGTAFEYLRNDKLDANDWFADNAGVPRPELRQNDFGGVFGGPIVRDKVFFFGSYEGLRVRQPEVANTYEPTLATIQSAPAAVQPLLNAFPKPNGVDLGNGTAKFTEGYSNPSSLNSYSGRIDYLLLKKVTIFGRYSDAPSNYDLRTSIPSEQLNYNTILRTEYRTQTLTFGASQAITPRLANEFRFNFSRSRAHSSYVLDDFGGGVPPPDSVLFPEGGSAQNSLFGFFGDFNPFGLTFKAGDVGTNVIHQINVTDALSYAVGAHQLRFGMDYRRLHPEENSSPYALEYVFGSLSNVVANSVLEAVVISRTPSTLVFSNWSLFAQDTWGIRGRITITYGLRWDYDAAPSSSNRTLPMTVTQVSDLATTTLAPLGTPLWHAQKSDFAPRLGIVWQALPTLVFRAGAGIFFDLGYASAANGSSAFPYSQENLFFSTTYPLGSNNLVPPQFKTTPPVPYLAVVDPNHVLPRTYEWNAAAEKSPHKSDVITLTYVGAAGRKLMRQDLYLAPNPNFIGEFDLMRNAATSSYNALQVQYRHRLAYGFQTLVSYTWAHSIDDASFDSNFLNTPLTVFPPSVDRGPSDYDVRHTFSGAISYNIPAPTGGAMKHIFGGWSTDSIIYVRSPPPVNVVTGQDAFNTGFLAGAFGVARPNLVHGVPLYVHPSGAPGGKVINAAAFSTPASGQGDLGRNALRGFGATQWDLTLRRQFRLTEQVSLQARGDFFNILNHANFGSPINYLSSPQFGQATQMLNNYFGSGGQSGGLNPLYQIGGPRSIQLALKLQF